MNDNLGNPNSLDEEIDLRVILNSVASFFKKLLLGLIQIFNFYFKHKFILLILIIVGAFLGYLWESSFDKTYTNKLLVLPNFNSVNYIYDKIESIDNKIKSSDTLTLKEIFGNNYKSVSSIEIKPKIDIYNFVSKSTSNKELFELMFEEEANLEFLENPINSMNYEFHNILLKVKGEENHKGFSDLLLTHLNENIYFQQMKDISLDNFRLQIEQNDVMISQIDSILNDAKSQKSLDLGQDKLSFADNTGLADLIKMRIDLLNSDRYMKVNMLKQTSIVKLIDSNYKTFENEELLQKSKIKLFPLILIVIYSFIFFIRFLTKKAQTMVS